MPDSQVAAGTRGMVTRRKEAPSRVPATEEVLRGSALLLSYRERVHFLTYPLSNGGKKTTSQAVVTGELVSFSSAPERSSISQLNMVYLEPDPGKIQRMNKRKGLPLSTLLAPCLSVLACTAPSLLTIF